ncbi:hypothetical protein VM99_11820 [Pseudomonas chlororaphis]|uniref:Uncharacterized protein n=1 Tax=Pseudomonas chlororaphis TaxID=587753 RepID=A0A0G3GC04_9PSED|nr:hypothetical protein VM99_11820 [Pseudomonas chlororaphis]
MGRVERSMSASMLAENGGREPARERGEAGDVEADGGAAFASRLAPLGSVSKTGTVLAGGRVERLDFARLQFRNSP